MSELPTKDYTHLDGQDISLSEAERQYGINHNTFRRWCDRGLIRSEKQGQKVIMNHGDVARQVETYQRDPGRGKWTLRKSQ